MDISTPVLATCDICSNNCELTISFTYIFSLFPHNEQAFPHCSLPSYFLNG
jgi:hypothetical protein